MNSLEEISVSIDLWFFHIAKILRAAGGSLVLQQGVEAQVVDRQAAVRALREVGVGFFLGEAGDAVEQVDLGAWVAEPAEVAELE